MGPISCPAVSNRYTASVQAYAFSLRDVGSDITQDRSGIPLILPGPECGEEELRQTVPQVTLDGFTNP